ncbi:MAG: transglycosylase SLT domain-containing protein [Gammaproteobacteria bacterium]|nr:transglycosylase SLT domain-containing protein [Gammaproteobacteria bacterium]
MTRTGRYWLLGAGPALLLATLALEDPTLPVDSAAWTERYDPFFRKYGKRYFGPTQDWRWFKAQGIAESGLDAAAISERGARGIMQMMPATFAEVAQAEDLPASIHSARWNIAAGIRYDAQLSRRFAAHGGDQGRALMLAAYNAGPRRMRIVQQRGRKSGADPQDWNALARHAPAATRFYVRRVFFLMGRDPDSSASQRPSD